ncbi:MAG: S8/S53 family peptidase [Microbacterium sp.]
MNPHARHGAHSEEWRRTEVLRWKVLKPTREPKDGLPAMGVPAGPESAGAATEEEVFDDQTSDDQAPDDQAPDDQAPDDQNPTAKPFVKVYSTVYVPDELIVSGPSLAAVRMRTGGIVDIARRAGWDIEAVALEDGRDQSDDAPLRARLSVASSFGPDGSGITAPAPDAWEVLRQARADDDGSAVGVSLNHVLTTDSFGLNPFTANPFTANPFTANPFTANPFTANAPGVGIASYGAPGFGNRQPVTYRGPVPVFPPGAARPIVAVFDTGLGKHPWFDGDVVLPGGRAIGIFRPETDPEEYPSLSVPLDGIFDDASGHGTFIAGIIRQECPEARILPVRVADGEGIILESELIAALRRLIDYITPNTPVDVLNLSFSFYHETPDDPDAISEITDLLRTLRDDKNVVVVCSAGNEATDRPTYPAALPGTGKRHVSVGALNPADHSVALFSNIGDWVDIFAPGVSIVSTVPIDFDGGIQAGTRDDKDGRRRETLDFDDFRGGFGVWSGTSFAAPVVAGRIASQISKQLSSRDQSGSGDPASVGGQASSRDRLDLSEAVRIAIADLESKDHSR